MKHCFAVASPKVSTKKKPLVPSSPPPNNPFTSLPIIEPSAKSVHNIGILKQGSDAAHKLNQLDSITLDKICKEFMLYTAEEGVKQRVTDRIEQILGSVEEAKKCVENLSTVYGIMEQSNYMLKGDMHSHSLHKMEEFFEEIAKVHSDKGYFDDRAMFEELFSRITENKNFRLPKLGIVDHTTENQKNLFERQLILEDECSSLALRRYLETYEFLAVIGRAHSTGRMKALVVEWLPEVVMAIKERQEYLRISPDISEKETLLSETLLKLEPAKLASISLVEFLKLTLAQMKHEQDSDEG